MTFTHDVTKCKKDQSCYWQKRAKTLHVNKALTAVKLKIFISIELPYWFKASFWPKHFGNLPQVIRKDNFTRGAIKSTRGEIESNIRKPEQLRKLEFWNFMSFSTFFSNFSSFPMFGSIWPFVGWISYQIDTQWDLMSHQSEIPQFLIYSIGCETILHITCHRRHRCSLV